LASAGRVVYLSLVDENTRERPPVPLRVRAWEPRDRETVLALADRFGEFNLPEGRTAGQIAEGTRAFLEHQLDALGDDEAVFVAEDGGGRALGFVYVRTDHDFFTGEAHGHVSNVAVARDAEGSGAGAALMREAERWARERGHGYVTLFVFAGNARALGLYDRLGYAPELLKLRKPLGS
jgi:ribosomal protein S18 acetylase RimI-like enzyme